MYIVDQLDKEWFPISITKLSIQIWGTFSVESQIKKPKRGKQSTKIER